MLKSLSTLVLVLLAVVSCCHGQFDDEIEGGLRRWGNGGGGRGGGGMGGGGGNGHGGGGMGGMGGGGGGVGMTIQNLLNNRDEIQRRVEETDTGAETRTWSDNEQVSSWIQKHVSQMLSMVNNGQIVRRWDPLFQELLARRDEMKVDASYFQNGVEATLTGSTECGVSLAQLHAEVVSKFVDNGRNELHQSHDVPDEC